MKETEIQNVLKGLLEEREILLGQLEILNRQIQGLQLYLNERVTPISTRPSTRDIIVEIFKEHGGPMHYMEILPLLQKRGALLNVKDPKSSMTSVLCADPTRFRRVKKATYDLVPGLGEEDQ